MLIGVDVGVWLCCGVDSWDLGWDLVILLDLLDWLEGGVMLGLASSSR